LSKSVAEDRTLSDAKNLKRQQDYSAAFNKFKQAFEETNDEVIAAYSVAGMYSCAKRNKSLLSFEKDLVSYTEDARKEPSYRAKICLGKLYAITGRIEKAEEIFQSFEPGTLQDREAVLRLLSFYVIRDEKEKAESFAKQILARFKVDSFIHIDIASAFELTEYHSASDPVYKEAFEIGAQNAGGEDEGMTLSAYPNPFNPTTRITYSVERETRVTIEIYNVLGQKVMTLVDGVVEPGSYVKIWYGRNSSGVSAAAGVYFATIHANKKNETIKLLLAR